MGALDDGRLLGWDHAVTRGILLFRFTFFTIFSG